MTPCSDAFLGSTFEPSTLVDLLRLRARNQPDQCAYTFLVDGETEEIHLTYGELDRRARAIAARLQSLGATGERALCFYPPGLEYIAAFFGCLFAGVIAVPAYPPRPHRPDPRIPAIVTDAQATVALTTPEILSDLERRFAHVPELKKLRWLVTDTVDLTLAEEWRDPSVSREALAFLQYTSGATAAPKGVMVSHGNLMHNQRLLQEGFEQTEHSVVLGWLPLYHDRGLIGNLLQPLFVGCPCLLMPPVAFLQQPFRWLKAISRYRVTTSGAPNFAYDLCVRQITPEQRATLDLSCWEVAFNGAESVRAATLETEQTFRAYLADTGEGPFLRTGDLGFLENGELFVTGRIKDLIIIRGANHYPEDIERTVETHHPSLRPGCGAAFSVDVAGEERLVIVFEVERHHLKNLDVDAVVFAIRQAVALEHEVPVYAVVLIQTGSIPKTSSGKIQRHACRARFLAGNLEVVGEWKMT